MLKDFLYGKHLQKWNKDGHKVKWQKYKHVKWGIKKLRDRKKKKKENKLSWKWMKKPTENILPKTKLQKNFNHMELCNSFNTEYS